MTSAVQLTLRALLAVPGRELYGLELVKATGFASGTIYPVLARLEDAGWISSRVEDIDPVANGRPRRRYYKLTEFGIRQARIEAERNRKRLDALRVYELQPPLAPRGDLPGQLLQHPVPAGMAQQVLATPRPEVARAQPPVAHVHVLASHDRDHHRVAAAGLPVAPHEVCLRVSPVTRISEMCPRHVVQMWNCLRQLW